MTEFDFAYPEDTPAPVAGEGFNFDDKEFAVNPASAIFQMLIAFGYPKSEVADMMLRFPTLSGDVKEVKSLAKSLAIMLHFVNYTDPIMLDLDMLGLSILMNKQRKTVSLTTTVPLADVVRSAGGSAVMELPSGNIKNSSGESLVTHRDIGIATYVKLGGKVDYTLPPPHVIVRTKVREPRLLRAFMGANLPKEPNSELVKTFPELRSVFQEWQALISKILSIVGKVDKDFAWGKILENASFGKMIDRMDGMGKEIDSIIDKLANDARRAFDHATVSRLLNAFRTLRTKNKDASKVNMFPGSHAAGIILKQVMVLNFLKSHRGSADVPESDSDGIDSTLSKPVLFVGVGDSNIHLVPDAVANSTAIDIRSPDGKLNYVQQDYLLDTQEDTIAGKIVFSDAQLKVADARTYWTRYGKTPPPTLYGFFLTIPFALKTAKAQASIFGCKIKMDFGPLDESLPTPQELFASLMESYHLGIMPGGRPHNLEVYLVGIRRGGDHPLLSRFTGDAMSRDAKRFMNYLRLISKNHIVHNLRRLKMEATCVPSFAKEVGISVTFPCDKIAQSLPIPSSVILQDPSVIQFMKDVPEDEQELEDFEIIVEDTMTGEAAPATETSE